MEKVSGHALRRAHTWDLQGHSLGGAGQPRVLGCVGDCAEPHALNPLETHAHLHLC